MATKTIHYCWFGKNKKSKLIKKCIKSWKKLCPDYQIIEWTEDNFDINCCKYVQEAYNAKKWAFVSDVCRFWVLYNYGGIYLDTDVELIKPLDELPDNFVGFEKVGVVNSGLIRGAEKGNSICKEMYDSYLVDSFVKKDGTLNLCTVCERESSLLKKYGLKDVNEIQVLEGTTVYPTRFFCPIDIETGRLNLTKDTYSIHRYAASWESKNKVIRGKVYRFLNRCFGKKIAQFFRKILNKKSK